MRVHRVGMVRLTDTAVDIASLLSVLFAVNIFCCASPATCRLMSALGGIALTRGSPSSKPEVWLRDVHDNICFRDDRGVQTDEGLGHHVKPTANKQVQTKPRSSVSKSVQTIAATGRDDKPGNADLAKGQREKVSVGPQHAASELPSESTALQFLQPCKGTSDDLIYVPCETCGTLIQMIVDTGAQVSVITEPLMRQLKLESKLDRSSSGVARGAGQARIIGKLLGIPVKIGAAAFVLDASVLTMEQPMLILGMDQMRRYRCIVDLERQVLVFGGSRGIDVAFLPAPPEDAPSLQDGCSLQ
eukprot:TRINITY_DN1847_c2_g1_i1.p1 TRINITY_DN1847_c2_g1~~TRINITY_DN1847_c2_g1_i1.p1  ORF type:complete len:301 (+),score=47.92 TRINITY_DN1847_c2_g1_i1:129-1031(+)